MDSRTLSRNYGLKPTGPGGAYRRGDYFRGAVVAAGVGSAFVAALWGLALALPKSESLVAMAFILGIGVFMAIGAALTLVVCGVINTPRPPRFADPSPPPRPNQDDE